MLTIREALEMPIFAEAQVVAGGAGLDHQITWVHIVDIPDAHFEWKRRGVLLLTAGYGLRNEPERQTALIPKLVEQGFAGMVLSIGHYFQRTPQGIKDTADRLGFPVIETPPHLLFIDITETVLEQIINRQYSLLQQSTQIHEKLTELVLQGGSLGELAVTLANLLERSITLEDPTFRVLAAAQFGPVDDARRRSLANGRTTPELARRLLAEGIYEKLLKSMAPVRVPPDPESGMFMERIVAPIIVDREIHGYIWIIAGDHPLTELDELAITRGATVAALILFKERAVRAAEETLRGDFFEQLLQNEDDPGFSAAFREQARRLNYHFDHSHQVLLLHPESQAGVNQGALSGELEAWLGEHGLSVLSVLREEGLVLVLEVDNDAAGKRCAEALLADLSHPACPLLIGIGGAWGFEGESPRGLRRSYEQSREALAISLALGRKEGVAVFSDLGMLHWLYHLPSALLEENVYLAHIQRLADHDAERGTDLVHSLESYLDHGGSLQESAAALFVHRNTLQHRLERIQALCPVDLRDPLHCLNLHVALKSYHLKAGK